MNGNKSCGGCTLCCTLVPVDAATLKKPAFTPCRHLRDMLMVAGPGCAIYGTRPHPCRVWSCVWLTSPDLSPELRPDRCGIVIDPVLDLIRVDGKEQAAVQIWVSPGHEEAFNTPIVQQAIHALLDQAPFILWRQKGPDGTQWGRAIGRDPNGNVGIGPLVKSNYDLGTEVERWARLDQMAAAKARRR